MAIFSKCKRCNASMPLIGAIFDLCDKCQNKELEERIKSELEVGRIEKEKQKQESERLEQVRQVQAADLVSRLQNPMAKLIGKYLNSQISINYVFPDKLSETIVLDVNDSYFTIRNGDGLCHFPLNQVLHIFESGNGVSIRVSQMLIPSGGSSISYGVSVPVGGSI